MRLEMQGQMRLEQKMKLAPHMIQSMEILQLPILALQERIEQELNSNPVLEIEEPSTSDDGQAAQAESDTPQTAVSPVDDKIEDFERINNLDDDYKDYITQTEPYQRRVRRDDFDAKFEAIKNTAAPPKSLYEHLSEQWQLVDAEDAVKNAGNKIIDYIDEKGYLSVRLEQLHNKDNNSFNYEDLKMALKLVQKLEPPGIGARNLAECLLIQMKQKGEDMTFEAKLVSEHMNELLENRLPAIAKKMDCSIDDINNAIESLSKLDTSPGLQISQTRNHPITADVIVEPLENSQGYSVRLAESKLSSLTITNYYEKLATDPNTPEKTKQFLQENIRSALWIIDAIKQRNSTLLKVTQAVVKHQTGFFGKGQIYLRPLPMQKIADEVGVHIATVSRTVAGKYVQCSWGLMPLRKFFSGGTENDNGDSLSWQAIRAKLQQIIDNENKAKPLSDDKIKKKLAEEGIANLARRTIAKYRKLLNIPPARLRKKY